MPDFDQRPFGDPDLPNIGIDNPEDRCAVVLVLDTSASMSGPRIDALNEGLRHFREELSHDALAMRRVEVAVVTFGPVQVQSDFVSAEDFWPPALEASGMTPMGEAVLQAIDLLSTRKAIYRRSGLNYYRPWIFLITDGAPTDSITAARQRIQDGEARKEFMFFAVGVEGADMPKLAELSVRDPLMLKGLAFRQLFQWLSSSLGAVSRSQLGDAPALTNPTGPNGWAVAG